MPHEAPPVAPAVRWWAWLTGPGEFTASFDGALHWWVAALYLLGSLLFCVAGVAGVVHGVLLSSGATSLNFWLIALPSMLAANLCFWPAGYLQVLEALNMGWAQRRAGWEKKGRLGPEPR